ncbi:MAG: carboxylate-amine ligase [Chloroflexi bacterium]|nr:carboxylate-amine ligase [Chloroflexota bacterium]
MANQAPSLTIGIEEEYQIIDPETRELTSYITQFLNEGSFLVDRELKPEFLQSQVELGTAVCANIPDLHEELARQRGAICYLAEQRGLKIVSAGTHPFSHWLKQEVTPKERYYGLLEEMQMLAQRLLIFGMHVHIGIEDRDFAIDCMNVMRYMVPHIAALATSSPFWMGRNTGLKSYRSVLFSDLPRTGLPDYFPDWASFEKFVNSLVNTDCIPDGSKIWWDVRPHFQFPTIEFRMCDACTTIDEAIAIAALVQAIVAWLWDLRQRNLTFRLYRRDLIEENRWRSIRYGIDGHLIDWGKEKELPARWLLRELLRLVDPYVEQLGSREFIEPIYHILEHGTSADRQLRVFKESGGDLKAVVDHLIEETRRGAIWPSKDI